MNSLKRTEMWFKKARPNPEPRDAMVQLGVHFEEVGEMLETVAGSNQVAAMLVMEANSAIKQLADHMKENPEMYQIYEEDRIAFLDSVCDQIVTAVGSGYMQKMKVIDGLHEVNRSNFSKFDSEGNPIFTTQGKIKKGPDYQAPDLTHFV